jgi:hypothetical protein
MNFIFVEVQEEEAFDIEVVTQEALPKAKVTPTGVEVAGLPKPVQVTVHL